MAKSCITVCFSYSLRMAIFLNTDISQGSVATRLGCGGVFVYHFVTNFLLSLTVKEFWKSVNIWWSYGQELGVLFFFDSQLQSFLYEFVLILQPSNQRVMVVIHVTGIVLVCCISWALMFLIYILSAPQRSWSAGVLGVD